MGLCTRIQRHGLGAPTEAFAQPFRDQCCRAATAHLTGEDLTMPGVLGKDVYSAAPEIPRRCGLPT